MYGLGYGGACYGAGYGGAGFGGAGFGGAGCGSTKCWYVAPTNNNCEGAGIIAIAVLILIALGAIFTF